jgi:pyruvate formate-lyase/glycerol dehydratase family glycyl radical enzyme
MRATSRPTSEILRDKVIPKTTRDAVWSKADEGEEKMMAVRPGVKLCLERARLVTESYKETEGEPMALRRAKALAKVLENMTIYIEEGQRIAGNYASRPECVAWYPDVTIEWLELSLNDGHRDVLDEKGKAELMEIHKYWREKNSLHRRLMAAIPRDLRRFVFVTPASFWGWHGHASFAMNLEKAFKVGLSGLIKEAEERLQQVESDLGIHAKDYIEQKEFLEAVKMSLDSGSKFIARYAQKAREMAQMAEDPEERERLDEIAEVCDWVSVNPPRTYHEALQLFWFLHLITNLIEFMGSGSGIRFDVVFYPFYKRDVEEGRITREEALELMKLLFVQFEGAGYLGAPQEAGLEVGDSLFQTINIGGIDADGNDVTNEISYIVLDAAKDLQTRQPTLALRYHDGTPPELIDKAIDVIRTGIGYPAIFNDKATIPHLLKRGLPLQDARNYSIRGCVVWTIPGKNIWPDRGTVGHSCLPKCLELALNRGIDKFTGKQFGYPTPDPETFKSIEDIMEAFLKQVNFFAEKIVRVENIYQGILDKYYPRPFSSAFIEGCIEKGKDCASWRYHSYPFILPLGPTNVADSLAAIKKLVFEEKKVTLKEIRKAVEANWESYEELYQMCLEAPKYGNDDDYVDSLAIEVHRRVNEEFKKFTDYFGYPIYADGSGAASNYGLAINTGATPDGRKDREAYADAVLSPVGGRDNHGPTAVLKSASKMDPVTTYLHLLNQRFQPQFLEGENKELFASYLKTWADLGIYHIQFNVVDKAILLDAQAHPEKYPNLIVRIAGYSAYFVDLGKKWQDEIIKRTEQTFGC